MPIVGTAVFALVVIGFVAVSRRVGRLHLTAPIVFNMMSYARASGRLPKPTLEALAADLKKSLSDGTFLLILPQFLVTGTA